MSNEMERQELVPMNSDNNPTDTSDVDFDMVMKNPASDALHWGAPPLNMYSSSDLFAIHEAARGELEARSTSAPDGLAEIPLAYKATFIRILCRAIWVV